MLCARNKERLSGGSSAPNQQLGRERRERRQMLLAWRQQHRGSWRCRRSSIDSISGKVDGADSITTAAIQASKRRDRDRPRADDSKLVCDNSVLDDVKCGHKDGNELKCDGQKGKTERFCQQSESEKANWSRSKLSCGTLSRISRVDN